MYSQKFIVSSYLLCPKWHTGGRVGGLGSLSGPVGRKQGLVIFSQSWCHDSSKPIQSKHVPAVRGHWPNPPGVYLGNEHKEVDGISTSPFCLRRVAKMNFPVSVQAEVLAPREYRILCKLLHFSRMHFFPYPGRLFLKYLT